MYGRTHTYTRMHAHARACTHTHAHTLTHTHIHGQMHQVVNELDLEAIDDLLNYTKAFYTPDGSYVVSCSRLEDEIRLSCAVTGELVGAYQVCDRAQGGRWGVGRWVRARARERARVQCGKGWGVEAGRDGERERGGEGETQRRERS
jgi:hypothetical protein